ncbi:permease [Peribacillus loiseleuriae]|uniref:Permease n=2 Tax=Peribacillus loiseleuriae TaxID=1679170 RepID=A0A0K9H170_9BACI|nr:permease [Peribacillus loiseleuriae]
MQRWFDIQDHETTLKKEAIAGITSFITVSYIIIVNASFLEQAGIPYNAAVMATIITSFVGCMIMGFWANAPIVLAPGMGINAFFSYSMVQSMGLSWQEALAVVFTSGIIFALIAFSPLALVLSRAVPQSLKEAIVVGLGFFLTFIGLQKGGIVTASDTTFVKLGDLSNPHTIVTFLTLTITVILFSRNVKGSFLLSIVVGSVISALFGLVDLNDVKYSEVSFGSYKSVLGAMSFESITSLAFWIATFSLTMVIVFENMGALYGLLQQPVKFRRSYKVSAVSTITAGIFGTSPTIATVESAAGIAVGGKTGITAIVAGILFLPAILFIPVLKIIPENVIAPVLIVVGSLMIQNIQKIELKDFSEAFPAFLIIALIPLSYSIVDGIAFGFIAYPLLKLALGRKNEVSFPLVLIAFLFLLNFVLS